MFRKLFGKDKAPARTLTSPTELRVGDLITFKPRSTLPACLQGETLEVIKVCAYEYPGGFEPEFTLKSSADRVVSLSLSEDSGDIEMTFSVEIPRDTVFSLFGEDSFAELWGENFAEITTRLEAAPPELEGWLAPAYRQTEKMAQAYFYNRDMRSEVRTRYVGEDAEELRYHACNGGADDDFGLSAEIWEGGETDVYVSKSLPLTVIEEMWPNAS